MTRMMRHGLVVLATLLWFAASSGASAASLRFAQVVAETSALAAMKPAAQQITISSAGIYTLTLTDLGRQTASANAFSSLFVVLYQGSTLIKSVALPTGATTVSGNASLSVGSYQVQVIGTTTGASQYGVELKKATGLVVWENSGAINVGVDDNTSLLKTVTVVPGQTYTVTVADRSFPATLSAMLFGVSSGGNYLGTCMAQSAGSCSFTATTNSVSLAVLAKVGAGGVGMYSVRVTGSGGDVYADTLPVGNLRVARLISLPISATYTLRTVDLAIPQPLTGLRAALVQGANVASLSAAGSANLKGDAGSAQLYVIAQPGSSSVGLYGVSVLNGTTSIYESVEAANPVASNTDISYQWTVPITTAGNYTVDLADFAVPATVGNLNWTVTQGSTTLQRKTGAGQLVISPSVGEVQVTATGNAANAGAGLLGISVKTAAGTLIYSGTHAAGDQIVTTEISLATGNYHVGANDFSTPVALKNLIAVVTHGADFIGRVDANGGSASVPLDHLSAGDYAISMFTLPQTGSGYGIFGVALSGEPTVSLSVSSTSITAGQSVTLTWSSTDASQCTASGGWSGTQPTEGSLTIASLTSNMSFVLTCSGPAGTTNKTVQVSVNSDSGSSSARSGGGTWTYQSLLALVLLTMIRLMYRGNVRYVN